jgi:galactose-1-phosphate uridylyltransferase
MGAPEDFLAFMPYASRWRTHRKLFSDFISASTVEDYDANQIKAVSKFLANLHRRPEGFQQYIELCVSRSL